jgi:hypothetical protein
MITIESDNFNIDDAVILILGGAPRQTSSSWDAKQDLKAIIFDGAERYTPVVPVGPRDLRQSCEWLQNAGTKSWEQVKSTWRLRAANGRWIPAPKDLGADLTID